MKWIKKARVLLIMTGSALFSESVGGYADTIDPVAFAGFRPAALGSAALSSTTNGLQVVHIGWALLDGVQLDLDNRAGRVNVLMAPVALNRQGARIRFETMAGLQAGREESMHTLSLRREANRVAILGHMGLASTTCRIDVLMGGRPVGSAMVLSDEVPGAMVGSGGLTQFAVVPDRNDGTVVYVAQFSGVMQLPSLAWRLPVTRFVWSPSIHAIPSTTSTVLKSMQRTSMSSPCRTSPGSLRYWTWS